MIISFDEFMKLNLKDEVFIIETDTVYGLGCLMSSEKGAKRIVDIKKRDNTKHFSLLVSNYDQVDSLTINSKDNIEFARRYWPGAVTFIFKKSNIVKDYISNLNTVGLRMPNNERTLKALDKFGPMIMTSVNYSGEPATVKFDDCLKFESSVDFIVRGDNLSGVPSTVYDIEKNVVLREGSVKF